MNAPTVAYYLLWEEKSYILWVGENGFFLSFFLSFFLAYFLSHFSLFNSICCFCYPLADCCTVGWIPKADKKKKRYPKIHTTVCVEERERERERERWMVGWFVGWLVVVSYSFCFEDCSPFVSFSFILLFLLFFFFFFFFLTYPIAGSIGSAATLGI